MGKYTGSVVVYSSFALAFFWTVLLAVPVGWHIKWGNIATFQVGVYAIKSEWNSFLGGKLAEALDKDDWKDGEWYEIGHYKEQMCLVGQNARLLGLLASGAVNVLNAVVGGALDALAGGMGGAAAVMPDFEKMCDAFIQLQWASYTLLFCGLVAVVCFVFGAFAVNFYYKEAAREKTRLLAQVFLSIAPIVLTTAMLLYTFATHDLFGWMGHAMGEHDGWSFNVSFWIAWVMTIFAWIPITAFMAWGKAAFYEDYNEALHDERKEQLREQMDLMQQGQWQQQQQYGQPGYGAAPAFGAPPQPGWGPGPQPGPQQGAYYG